MDILVIRMDGIPNDAILATVVKVCAFFRCIHYGSKRLCFLCFLLLLVCLKGYTKFIW